MKYSQSVPISRHGSYLSKIQYFRGFAILIVLLYHLNAPFFEWGFVGVDIFFVLSGFLMMAIYPNFANAREILKFYQSRWLRIFPALSVVLMLTIAIGYFFLLPNESFVILKESFFGITGLANINYWLGEQYFVSSTFRPLLNLWSLGIELQFYVLYPILLLVVRRYPKALYLLFFLSLSGFLLLSKMSPQTIFYLLPFRLWEFIAGIFLAQNNYYSRVTCASLTSIQKGRKIFLTLSITLVSLFIWRISSTTAMLVSFTILSTVVLLSSRFNLRNQFLLKLKNQIVILGDYSYIVYLLHFPIIIIMNYQPLDGNNLGFNSMGNLLSILLLVAVLAYLGHRFIENKIRRDLKFRRLQSIFIPFLIIFIAVNLLTSLNSKQFSGYPVKSIKREVAAAVEDHGTYRCGALARLNLLQYFPAFQSCALNHGQFSNRVLLVGNSHADAIKETLASIYSRRDTSLLFLSENRSLDKTQLEQIQKLFERKSFTAIVLHSSPGANDLDSINALALWSRSKGVSLNIIGPIPVYESSVPLQILKGKMSVLKLDNFERTNANEIRYLRFLDEKFTEVSFMDMGPIFCTPICALRDTSSRKILYRDHGHLTLSARNLLLGPLTVFLASHKY